MKNLKKIAALGLAAAVSMSVGVSAFADTYTPNTPENTTGNYTAPSDTVQESIKLSSVNFMNDGEQYTVVLFKVDTNTDGSVNIESANRTLVADDLFYINQGTKDESFWVTTGMGPKGTKLADGTYILRIGGENVTSVFEIPLIVSGTKIIIGDVNGDGKVTAADTGFVNAYCGVTDKDAYNEAVNLLIGKLVNGYVIGDVNGDGKVTAADTGFINAFCGVTDKDAYNAAVGLEIGKEK